MSPKCFVTSEVGTIFTTQHENCVLGYPAACWQPKQAVGSWESPKKEGCTENLLGPDNHFEFLKHFMNILLKN